MNDVEYVLRKDIAEKKATARGAYHKRNGSKSKKCSLPHEKLTKSQLKKMNGEVKMYDLSKPMSYYEFKSMPNDLQIEYLTKLRDKFGASLTDIAHMLHTTCSALSEYKKSHLGGLPKFVSYKNSRLITEKWLLFTTGGIPYIPSDETIEKEAEEIGDKSYAVHAVEVDPRTEAPYSILTKGEVEFHGDPNEVITDIFRYFSIFRDENTKYSFKMKFEKLD